MTEKSSLCATPDKIRYESEVQAAAYAKAFAIGAPNHARANRPYWCPAGHWHLASGWRKRGKARESSAKRQKRQRLLAEGVWESEGGALR